MRSLIEIGAVLVPREALQHTCAYLRQVGELGCEGLTVWAGRRDGKAFHVECSLIPEQRHLQSGDGVCVIVEADALHRLNVFLHEQGLLPIAQVHSHPGEAYHSGTDDQYAVVTKVGCLSLVVPDFASKPFALGDCAVYRLTADGRWGELTSAEAADLIKIVD
jgi:hypothetical protein